MARDVERIATTIARPASPRCTLTGTARPAASAPIAPAVIEPTLHMPWKPWRIERPYRRWTPIPWAFIAASIVASNAPMTRNARARTPHEPANPTPSTRPAVAVPATVATRPLPKRAMSAPANRPINRPPIGPAATARPSSEFVRPSASLIAGSLGSTDAEIAPFAKNSTLTAIRADRARVREISSAMGDPWCPRCARDDARLRVASGGHLSYRHGRCLSSPRSRPSRATSGATCCPTAAGPARRSPARESRGPGRSATRIPPGSSRA